MYKLCQLFFVTRNVSNNVKCCTLGHLLSCLFPTPPPKKINTSQSQAKIKNPIVMYTHLYLYCALGHFSLCLFYSLRFETLLLKKTLFTCCALRHFYIKKIIHLLRFETFIKKNLFTCCSLGHSFIKKIFSQI